jgi:RNA polymerase sigma-70 factor (ECF subfamily)
MEFAEPADGVERLYRETREALAGYFLRRHRAAHAVEDLLHETFLRLMKRADRLGDARSPRAYLFGIARHVSAEAWRRADPPAADDRVLETLAAAEPDPRLAAARETIAALPDLQREILDLRFQHDLSYAEIAEALGVPVGTVRSRLHNAMRLLRARLAQDDAASDGRDDRERRNP